MIEKLSGSSGNFLAFKASEKLTDNDYKEIWLFAIPVGNFRISNRGLRDSKACQEFGQGGNW